MGQIKRIVVKLFLAIGLPAIIVIGLRLVFVTPDELPPHYHADFAIFIYGQRLDLDNPGYYEEEGSCQEVSRDDPRSRAHLHQPDPGVVHVHDQAVTWGHFLTNLGFELSDDSLKTRSNTYSDGVLTNNEGQPYQLRFYLNGSFVNYLTDRVIGDEDVLIIDYSNQTEEEIISQRAKIEIKAALANQLDDPAGCFGSGNSEFGPQQRFKKALIFWR